MNKPTKPPLRWTQQSPQEPPTRIPLDLTDQVRAIHAANRRRQAIAFCGVAVFITLVGIALGSLAASGGFGHTAAIIALSAWGCYSLNWLIKRS